MEKLDIKNAIHILKQLGISPEQLGPERLRELMKITDFINNPTDITPEATRNIMDIIGLSVKKPKSQIYVKIPRNSPCPCGKYGKKYKKCCWISDVEKVNETSD
jgi:uncharacterized protein YecA (UPF0149 family)